MHDPACKHGLSRSKGVEGDLGCPDTKSSCRFILERLSQLLLVIPAAPDPLQQQAPATDWKGMHGMWGRRHQSRCSLHQHTPSAMPEQVNGAAWCLQRRRSVSGSGRRALAHKKKTALLELLDQVRTLTERGHCSILSAALCESGVFLGQK